MLYSVKEQNNNVINSDVKYIQWQKTVLIFCLDLAFFKKMMNILGNICMVGASGFDQIGFVHPWPDSQLWFFKPRSSPAGWAERSARAHVRSPASLGAYKLEK